MGKEGIFVLEEFSSEVLSGEIELPNYDQDYFEEAEIENSESYTLGELHEQQIVTYTNPLLTSVMLARASTDADIDITHMSSQLYHEFSDYGVLTGKYNNLHTKTQWYLLYGVVTSLSVVTNLLARAIVDLLDEDVYRTVVVDKLHKRPKNDFATNETYIRMFISDKHKSRALALLLSTYPDSFLRVIQFLITLYNRHHANTDTFLEELLQTYIRFNKVEFTIFPKSMAKIFLAFVRENYVNEQQYWYLYFREFADAYQLKLNIREILVNIDENN